MNFILLVVQYEVNESGVATDFEHRSYGQELALCQRYFYTQDALTPNDIVFNGYFGGGNGRRPYQLPVTMRAAPNVTFNSYSQLQVYESSGWTNRNLSVSETRKEYILLGFDSTSHNYNKLINVLSPTVYPILYASAEL